MSSDCVYCVVLSFTNHYGTACIPMVKCWRKVKTVLPYSHTMRCDFHYETYIGISPYRTPAVVWAAVYGCFQLMSCVTWSCEKIQTVFIFHTLFIRRVLYFPISHSNEHRLHILYVCRLYDLTDVRKAEVFTCICYRYNFQVYQWYWAGALG